MLLACLWYSARGDLSLLVRSSHSVIATSCEGLCCGGEGIGDRGAKSCAPTRAVVSAEAASSANLRWCSPTSTGSIVAVPLVLLLHRPTLHARLQHCYSTASTGAASASIVGTDPTSIGGASTSSHCLHRYSTAAAIIASPDTVRTLAALPAWHILRQHC
jgi:hypothetical protein